MKLALRELRRRPGRFLAATAVLTVLAVLLMFLGGLLDGLLAGATGAYRAQPADAIVYSTNARESLVRSRIEAPIRDAVEGVDGVAEVGGLGSIQLGARPGSDPDARELISTALLGYEMAPRGLPDEPPGEGQVIADTTLKADDIEVGDTLLLGPARTEVEVVGFVEDTNYAGQTALWASLDTWRSVTEANRPDRVFADDAVAALVVRIDGDASSITEAIDEATEGATDTLTLDAAIEALPGVSQQRSTFNQIIGVTTVIALVVVGLFFALITVERTALYGILKAIGGSSRTLFGGVLLQAVLLALIASALATAAAVALASVIPPGTLPFVVTGQRILTSVVLMVVAAMVGCAFSLRRVLRIDPAAAIGTAS
ncbi:MAG: ABC transporter permease [Acidimicrobiales bacterium]|nr:ABC transporter permease [Acidimicrobiales bacterium]